MLLGVTNPLFGKLLSEWPNRLWLSSNLKGGAPDAPAGAAAAAAPPSAGAVGGAGLMVSTQLLTKQLLPADRDVMAQAGALKAASSNGPSESAAAANELLRRHFMQKTIAFMAPLEEFQHLLVTQAQRCVRLVPCAALLY